ncbi:MAG: MazG nucleotide pyrophosphohydrolase domain-containing protein [Candidatus Bilamarchaeum sp.]|jgi:NTP pyrophosphatase (non-canonical NTP hydrolase)
MKSKISKLIELSEKNVELCPWCKEKSSGFYFTQLKSEIEELENAFKNNDLDNIEEEIGDVLWDTITLVLICEREKKVDSTKIITRVLEKFERRKPWLLTGQKVTREESGRIWDEAKKLEKSSKK